jgi:hypothetical protein
MGYQAQNGLVSESNYLEEDKQARNDPCSPVHFAYLYCMSHRACFGWGGGRHIYLVF